VCGSPYGRGVDCDGLFDVLQQLMLSVGGRPHWAKRHNVTCVRLGELYGANFHRFRQIRDILDPSKMFTNDYLQRVLGD